MQAGVSNSAFLMDHFSHHCNNNNNNNIIIHNFINVSCIKFLIVMYIQ